MKVTDYRIGNLVNAIVQDENGKESSTICRITAIDENGSLGDGYDYMLESIKGESYEYYEDSFPISLSKEWLLRFGFVQKQPYGWHGNGYDYQIPAIEGGSTTEYHDFVIYNVLGDLDFIVRFSSYKYGSNIEDEDKSISFHLCEWHEKCANEVICFDTTKIHLLQNAFYQSLGSELELKSLPENVHE